MDDIEFFQESLVRYPRLRVVAYLVGAIFIVYGFMAIVHLILELVVGAEIGVLFVFPFGASPMLSIQNLTLAQAIGVYLPPSFILFGIAGLYRRIQRICLRRYMGIVAGFRAWISLFPVLEISYIAGSFGTELKPVNAANVVLCKIVRNMRLPVAMLFGALGVFAAFIFADTLTKETFTVKDLTGKHILSILFSLLVTLVFIHEPGHMLLGLVTGAKVDGAGLMFPVGAFTSFASMPQNLFAVTLIVMGGNLFTLIAAFVINRFDIGGRFFRHLGMFCGLSTFLNATIPIGIGLKGGKFLVGIGTSTDAAVLLSMYLEAAPVLIVVAFAISVVMSLKGIWYLNHYIGGEGSSRLKRLILEAK